MSYLIPSRGEMAKLALEDAAAGIFIWCKDFIAMGEPPRTEYRVSFAVAFPPETPMEAAYMICGVLVREVDVARDCRIYDGTQTEPDPLIEKDTGSRIAFTGTKYAVFEDLLLTPFNNTIPDIYFGRKP